MSYKTILQILTIGLLLMTFLVKAQAKTLTIYNRSSKVFKGHYRLYSQSNCAKKKFISKSLVINPYTHKTLRLDSKLMIRAQLRSFNLVDKNTKIKSPCKSIKKNRSSFFVINNRSNMFGIRLLVEKALKEVKHYKKKSQKTFRLLNDTSNKVNITWKGFGRTGSMKLGPKNKGVLSFNESKIAWEDDYKITFKITDNRSKKNKIIHLSSVKPYITIHSNKLKRGKSKAIILTGSGIATGLPFVIGIGYAIYSNYKTNKKLDKIEENTEWLIKNRNKEIHDSEIQEKIDIQNDNRDIQRELKIERDIEEKNKEETWECRPGKPC